MLAVLLWDLGEEVRHKYGQKTTPPLLHGVQHCEGTQGGGSGSTHQSTCGMDGGIPHWDGGEAPTSGFMDRGYGQTRSGLERKEGLILGDNCIDQLRITRQAPLSGSPKIPGCTLVCMGSGVLLLL